MNSSRIGNLSVKVVVVFAGFNEAAMNSSRIEDIFQSLQGGNLKLQ
jgi:hypothetical protein